MSQTWKVPVTHDGSIVRDEFWPDEGDRMVPVVPCDEAAIERAAAALAEFEGERLSGPYHRRVVELVLRAAGEEDA